MRERPWEVVGLVVGIGMRMGLYGVNGPAVMLFKGTCDIAGRSRLPTTFPDQCWEVGRSRKCVEGLLAILWHAMKLLARLFWCT
jgi:hypothetical protein